MLNNEWYDDNQYQKYAFEYIPGGEDGAIAWFVGDDETFRMSGESLWLSCGYVYCLDSP